MKKIELTHLQPIAEGIYLEGLAVDEARQLVWYSDVVGGGVFGVNQEGELAFTLNSDRRWTGGIYINSDGCILSSGAGGIMWNHPESGDQGWLINELNGQTANGINEMWSDGAGGLFFGTVDIERVAQGQKTRPTALYHLGRDRSLTLLVDDVNFSNGFVYAPSSGRFYLSDSFNVAWAFDVGPNLSLNNRRVLLDKKDCDGMVIDQEGNIWISGFASPNFISRVSPEGDELSPVQTPPGATTQMRFGGDDLKDIYLTIVPMGGGDSLKKGEKPRGGSQLLKGRSSVAGVAPPLSHFVLR